MRKARSPAASRSFVASLGKGLDVLTCFDRAHPKLTLSEVASRTSTTPASARRALLTLQALGYLQHDGRRFRLGPKALLVANAYLASRPLPTIAQPLLESLAERFGAAAALVELIDDEVIVLARSAARRSLVVGLSIGSRLPAYCSATGRVLLAALAPADALARVRAMSRPALTPRTRTTVEAVMAQVDACRADGYAVSDGELELDVRSAAVAVLDRTGTTVAAVSTAVRAERMSLAELKQFVVPALQRAQARLRSQLAAD